MLDYIKVKKKLLRGRWFLVESSRFNGQAFNYRLTGLALEDIETTIKAI